MFDLTEEKNLFSSGYRIVGGIDEAGRGPLAGPVVAACVILRNDTNLSDKIKTEVKDSKKLSGKKREEIFELIMENAPETGVGICSHETIDRINILQASFLAMKKALGEIKEKPEFIMLDGKFPIPNMSIRQKPVIKGDNLVFSIAAASIIAKVTRDRIMENFHKEYPAYFFDKHKGYGTKLHMEKLKEHGPCPIHRKSFAPVRRAMAGFA